MCLNVAAGRLENICIPPQVLNRLRQFNIYRDKDLRKWIGNCDIYNKVFIAKTLAKEKADLSAL